LHKAFLATCDWRVLTNADIAVGITLSREHKYYFWTYVDSIRTMGMNDFLYILTFPSNTPTGVLVISKRVTRRAFR
jgi:hypothetical protein